MTVPVLSCVVLCCVYCLWLSLPVVCSKEWRKESYPNPQRDYQRCGNPGNSPAWLCDPDKLLTQNQRKTINGLLTQIIRSTPCPCGSCSPGYGGFHVSLALAESIYLRGHTGYLKRQSAEFFASYLRETAWRFGKCDDDIVVLVSVNDDLIYTNVGSRAKTKQLMTYNCRYQAHIPAEDLIKEGNIYQGVKHLVQKYMYTLQGKTTCEEDTSSVTPVVWYVLLAAGVLVGVGCLIYASVRCIRWRERGRRRRTLDEKYRREEEERLRAEFVAAHNAGDGGGREVEEKEMIPVKTDGAEVEGREVRGTKGRYSHNTGQKSKAKSRKQVNHGWRDDGQDFDLSDDD